MTGGSLRVYLGAAPGVGKTFAMLAEGRRRRQRGTDVVVAAMDPKGRAATAGQVSGLEVVPPLRLWNGGQPVEELDLGAVLCRGPRVALVDELGHVNAPGCRHANRWQDVEDMLDAGIDVVSTVGVEQLESLRDVVESVTGVSPAETIPDQVVRRASQIELVDMTPEALRRRLAHGNICSPDEVDAVLANYFRPGNLAALRELALLWLADRVEEGLLDYRRSHAVSGVWETRERILVAVTPAPGSDAVVRRAARIATRARAHLIGVHVHTAQRQMARETEALRQRRALLEELGGAYREVMGTDAAHALIQVAAAENATQIVLGATRRGRLAELSRGSVVSRVIRESGGSVDVHVVSDAGGGAVAPGPRWRSQTALSWRRQLAAMALAALALPLLTLLLTHVRAQVGFAGALPSYLLVVTAVATAGGVWPALPTVAAAFLLLDWFFVPPLHTFQIADVQLVSALAAYVVVASVVSALVALVARRAADAHRARAEAEALAGMAGSLLRGDGDLSDLMGSLAATFSAEGVALVHLKPGGWDVEAAAGSRPPHAPEEASLVIPLSGDMSLAVAASELSAEDQGVLHAFAAQLALALESRRLATEAASAAARAETNELRTGLLAAISHDLRSPLAAIKASATSLLSDDVVWEPAAARELLATIDTESDRLNTLVANLLDMSRLRAGAVVVRSQPVALEEVTLKALGGLPSQGRKVQVDVSETLPQVDADPALLERVVANLIGNALRFSPESRPVRVKAGVVASRVDLRIVDRGPGVPAAERERIFQPFQRLGDSPRGAGVGLGLAVARGFADAMGAELSVEDTPGGGATMVVSLPAAGP
ncbi:MAG: ATP-binding protein [Acidimicrobiales bacterium]